MSAAVLAGKVLDMDIPSLLEDFQYHGSLKDDIGQTWILRVPSSLPSPEDIAGIREELNGVYASMSRLNDCDFGIFMMKYYDNCRISEISNEYGMSRSRVYTSLENSRKSIRQTLQTRGQLI